MAISVVLRLVERALVAGRLAGEAEIVETGERRVVQDAEDIVRFLRPATSVENRGSGASEPRPVE